MFCARGARRDPARAAQPAAARARPVALGARWCRGSRTRRTTVRIGIVGKYVELPDAYKSLNEALVHGGIANDAEVELVYIDAEELEAGGWPRELLRGRRHPGADRLRRARHRGQDPRDPLRPRAQGAVLRHLPRHAVHGDRVRAQRLRHRGRHLDRVRSRDRAAGDLQAARPARRRGDGRHDAPRRLPLPPARRDAGAPHLRRRRRSASATATATRSTRSTWRPWTSTAWWSPGISPDGKFVEMVELADHPWFLGCQFHPEYKSKPTEPHPLFVSYIARRARGPRRSRREDERMREQSMPAQRRRSARRRASGTRDGSSEEPS